MSHDYATEFHGMVAAWLDAHFGERNVTHQLRLTDTGRTPDFWVHAPLAEFAVEVATDFEAAVDGAGRAVLHAAHHANAVPVVVVPKDRLEYPEARYLRDRSPVVLREVDL